MLSNGVFPFQNHRINYTENSRLRARFSVKVFWFLNIAFDFLIIYLYSTCTQRHKTNVKTLLRCILEFLMAFIYFYHSTPTVEMFKLCFIL